LPLPSHSPNTTPLGVACILPPPSSSSQLDRFLKETSQYTNKAKIILWPEGAVTFENETVREKAFDAVKEMAYNQKAWIGVSFEERLGAGEGRRDGLHRNGLALIGPDNKVEMTYYKRRLVPIAESYSFITDGEVPPVHTIELPRPKIIPEEEWGGTTRSIPLSASICLDFSVPLTSLSSRPSLILAPAKTWHAGVGRAMYELARVRGKEIGAEVLWCDGGAESLSGVAGDVNVGTGSWVKTIGVPYPAEEKRTIYGYGGDLLVLGLLVAVSGSLWLIEQDLTISRIQMPDLTAIRQALPRLFAAIRSRLPGGRAEERATAPTENTPLLIDV